MGRATSINGPFVNPITGEPMLTNATYKIPFIGYPFTNVKALRYPRFYVDAAG